MGLELRAFVERVATSLESDPVRRIRLEFERDPDVAARAVLELLGYYLGGGGL